MEDSRKITFSVVDDIEIVELLDRMADEEATSRGAIVRRAIRRLLFSLPTVPTFTDNPEAVGSTVAPN